MTLENRLYSFEEVLAWDDPEEVMEGICIEDHVEVTLANGFTCRGEIIAATNRMLIISPKWMVLRKHIASIKLDY